MSGLLRTAIVLAVAWLISLIGLVIFGPAQADHPSRLRRLAQTVGASAMTVTVGFAFLLLVAMIVRPFLPAPDSTVTTRRIDALERWQSAHDSLHKSGTVRPP